MKTATVQQELLLVTTSGFIQRPLCENNSSTRDNPESTVAKLEEACWNGMLEELLPGMIEKASSGKNLYLWQIHHTNAFMIVDLCEFPVLTERIFSIDPYYFLTSMFCN